MILVDQLFSYLYPYPFYAYVSCFYGKGQIQYFLHPVEHFQVKDIAEHFSIGIGF